MSRDAMAPAGRLLLVGACSLLLCACGLMAPRSQEGFADLDSPGAWDADRTLALSIGPTVLNFAARHVEGDPQAAALLSGLDGVRVRMYRIDGDGARVARRLERMSNDLQAEGWEPVALVREQGEQVHVLVKSRPDAIQGLVVMATDSVDEVVLVNLMGHLQPEMFADVMLALEVDVPDFKLASID
jgi:hypothetical protein